MNKTRLGAPYSYESLVCYELGSTILWRDLNYALLIELSGLSLIFNSYKCGIMRWVGCVELGSIIAIVNEINTQRLYTE